MLDLSVSRGFFSLAQFTTLYPHFHLLVKNDFAARKCR